MNEQVIRNALDDLETCSEKIKDSHPYEAGMITEIVTIIKSETGVDDIGHALERCIDVDRVRLACERCGNEVSVYSEDGEPAVICECGAPMDQSVDTGPDQGGQTDE